MALLWKPLMGDGLVIDFAWRTFKWDSESSKKAHVYCVVVGFSSVGCVRKTIFDSQGGPITAENINGYLTDAPNTFIESRTTPLCNVPLMGIGNKPIDGGNYLFSLEEMNRFVKKEPASQAYFHPYYGSDEFINRRPRFCLWLGDCTPAQIRAMPHCYERVKNVRELRLKSKSEGTRKLADRPTRFHVENMPETDFIIIPRVSSEKREYIPIGFMGKENIVSDSTLIIPNATLFHFGILTSSVHMAWTRAVCGRLEMRYRYSKDIVYNNYPWPEVTKEQKQKIEKTAGAILEARRQYPDSSLADLYNDTLMPQELRKAHQANDRAVAEAYGFPPGLAEEEMVARLFEIYSGLAG